MFLVNATKYKMHIWSSNKQVTTSHSKRLFHWKGNDPTSIEEGKQECKEMMDQEIGTHETKIK